MFRNSLFHLIKVLKYADRRSFLCLCLNTALHPVCAVGPSTGLVAPWEETLKERVQGHKQDSMLGENVPSLDHGTMGFLNEPLPPVTFTGP